MVRGLCYIRKLLCQMHLVIESHLLLYGAVQGADGFGSAFDAQCLRRCPEQSAHLPGVRLDSQPVCNISE